MNCVLCRLNELCQNGKLVRMDLKKDTTRNHNHIDHILVLEDIKERVFSTCFFNFVSDHKSIVARVGGKGNMFSDHAKHKMFFDPHKHIKKIQKNDDIILKHLSENQRRLSTPISLLVKSI